MLNDCKRFFFFFFFCRRNIYYFAEKLPTKGIADFRGPRTTNCTCPYERNDDLGPARRARGFLSPDTSGKLHF